MKWKRTNVLPIILALICIAVSTSLFGQKQPEAILVDEHGEIGCDDTLNRIDIFFSDLRNNPNDSGLVVISGMPENKHRIVFRQTIVEHQIKWRQFEAARIRIVRSRGEETRIQFWRIPPGADQPFVKNLDMSFTIPNTVKPFMMGEETKIGDQICPEVDDAEIFAAFLKANDSAHGNIVVRGNSPKRARQKADRIARHFSRKYGIATNRLRTFTAEFTRPQNWGEAIIEYWYLP